MSRRDAFDEEMAFLRRMTSADEERVLHGREPRSSEFAELATFARSLRATMVVEPDPGASAVLVGRMAAAARASASTRASTAPAKPAPRRRPRLALVARIAVAATLLPLFMAALAVAGVSLPGAAQSAFEGVGVELPNQSGADGSEDDGAGTGAGAGEEGSAQEDAEQPASAPAGGDVEGQAKDKAAKEQGAGKLKSNPAREQGRGHGTQGRGRAIGKQGVPPGHLNPNRGGQGNGRAVGKTDSPPPGHAKASKPPKPKPSGPKPKPPKQNPGGGKLKSK